jgi:hypothetical protein
LSRRLGNSAHLEELMIKKTFVAAAAMGLMTIGLMSAPANAWHRHHGSGIIISIGGHGPGYRHNHCHRHKFKRHGHWVKVRHCHRHRSGHH